MNEQITVVGTVASAPEHRTTAAGHSVINFRLASTARRRDEATGAWTDGATNWFAVSAYRGLAEHALESFQKGHRVIVTGSFRLREWESNGRRGVTAEIDAIALGHDLLWATTVYRRAGGPAADDDHRRPDAAAGGGEHPGPSSHPGASVAPVTGPAGVRADADSWSSPLLQGETPF